VTGARNKHASLLAPTPCCANTAVKNLDADAHSIRPNSEWQSFQLLALIKI